LCGGHAAAAGLNLLMRSDGIDINVGAKARLPVERGDTICINTPGGLLRALYLL
jgi:N-methylhydantoinase B/oxoprolinase/acetone carboxylase alpha subunit